MNQFQMLGILLAGLALLGGGVYMKTRGLRNNNAGNIELNNIKWNGMASVQNDGRFIIFKAPEFGIRALAKILLSYQRKHGISTVRGVINRYAPSNENNTQAYVKHVADMVGASPDAPLDFGKASVMKPMVEAIIKHENGLQPYSTALIDKGLRMAGVA